MTNKNGNEETRKIIKFIQQIIIGIHERFDNFDYVIGRRTLQMQIKTDSLDKELTALGKEIREQYYSIGRRIDLLQDQINKMDKITSENKTSNC